MRKQSIPQSLVMSNIRGLKAYEAKDVPCRIKLDANESPYGFKLSAKSIATNRYPDPEARALRSALAKEMGIGPDGILLGNGSDELITMLVATFGGPVLYPTPTFVMYGIIARALDHKIVEVPLNETFDLDGEAMLRAVRAAKPKLIFLSIPNNPTGNRFSDPWVMRLIESAPGLVIVDEAYQPFANGEGHAQLMGKYPRLMIMRTLSKVGFAALRVGYLSGAPELIEEINKVRLPFNVNSLSQAHAEAAVKDRAAIRKAVAAVRVEREKLWRSLQKVGGITPSPSEANFVLFRVSRPGMATSTLHAALLKRGVLIKDLGATLKGCMRVTVGLPRENAAFIKALKEAMAR